MRLAQHLVLTVFFVGVPAMAADPPAAGSVQTDSEKTVLTARQKLAQRQAEVQRLEGDLSQREAASQQAEEQLRQREEAIAELRRQLRELPAAAASTSQ